MRAALLSIVTVCLFLGQAYSQTTVSDPSPTSSPVGEKAAEKSNSTVTPSKPSDVKVGKAALALPSEKSNPVRLVRFEKPPTIDGKLDDDVWKTAAVLKDFYQVQPGDNLIPENRTEVRLGYDARFLYIAFHCFDDPTKVRATVAKRDDIWNDDYVGILFSTLIR